MVTSDTTSRVCTLHFTVLFSNSCPPPERLQWPTAEDQSHRSIGRSVLILIQCLKLMYTYFKPYFSATKWDKHNLCCVLFFKIPSAPTCSKCSPSATVHSQQWCWTERHTVWIVANEISLMPCSKFDEHWISQYKSHENIASLTSLGIVQKPAWLHQHSRYQWNLSFSAPTFQHVFHRCIVF